MDKISGQSLKKKLILYYCVSVLLFILLVGFFYLLLTRWDFLDPRFNGTSFIGDYIDKTSHFIKLIQTETRTIAFSVFTLFLGIFTGILFFLRWKYKEFLLFLFSLFLIINGFSNLYMVTSFKVLFINLYSREWLFFYNVISALLPPITIAFFEYLFNSRLKNFIHIVWKIEILTAAVYLIYVLITSMTGYNATYSLIMPDIRLGSSLGLLFIALNLTNTLILLPHILLADTDNTIEYILAKAASVAMLLGYCIKALVVMDVLDEALDFIPTYCSLAFILSLGYIIERRFYRNQSQLLSIEQELRTARKIQNSILPKCMPGLEGFDVAVRYIPMTAVAGDYYDFQILNSGSLGVLVADVSGHGVPAAMIASMIKMAFTFQSHNLADPAQFISEMNRNLCGNLENQFITAGYLFFDRQNKRFLYANAAHPPLYLLKKESQELITIKPKGTVIGYFPDMEFENYEASLDVGDRLILYTDGIVEAENDKGESFGEKEFHKFIMGNQDLTATQFSNRLIDYLIEWSGRKNSGKSFEDDITLAVIDIESM